MVILVTVFYSNGSGNSKALLQQIKNSTLMDEISVKLINIDNVEIRKIVLKKFLVVPTIVVIQQNVISLYSGENAFEWFNQQSVPSHKVPREASPQPKSILEVANEISKDREAINF